MTLELVLAGLLAQAAAGPPPLPPLPPVRDSLVNGAAIGAGIGGGALAAMARACSNTNCSDTSANLDPRIALVGALAGAGIGALVDAVTVHRAGTDQPLAPSTARSLTRAPGIVFARAGWSGLSDDEGSLGSGATFGAGVVVPFGSRFGLQVAYDRQKHRRDLESGAPPGVRPPPAGFSGTEQLFTAKTLIYFRSDKAVRPYAGIGLGLFNSRRVSEFPNYAAVPGGIIVPVGSEVFRYHSRDVGLGFAAGIDARVTTRFSILADLTLDLARQSALGSTRLTVGGGWHF